jgi:hypothetical protein
VKRRCNALGVARVDLQLAKRHEEAALLARKIFLGIDDHHRLARWQVEDDVLDFSNFSIVRVKRFILQLARSNQLPARL